MSDFFRNNYEAYELLQDMYSQLKENEEISEETKKFIIYFFEDKKKFVNEWRRELRRRDGCVTYFDENGYVRFVSNGELKNPED